MEQPEDNEVFVRYEPFSVGPNHPGDIVETKTLHCVKALRGNYRHSLGDEIVGANGTISNVQLDAVVLAGSSHAKFLGEKNVERKGFVLGNAFKF